MALKSMIGERYGRLTIVKQVPSPHGRKDARFWLCRCDCGAEKTVLSTGEFNSKRTASCGCYHREVSSRVNRQLHLTHGGTHTRLYNVWSGMRRRCFTPSCKEYPLYGGRGITVCEEWGDYSIFRDWAYANGYDDTAPRGQFTLDRIDVNGNYCPENCRWATHKEQMNNTRVNRYIEYNGERKTAAEWSCITGIPAKTISERLKYNWPVEEILFRPVRRWK